jgi:hypothetical protein
MQLDDLGSGIRRGSGIGDPPGIWDLGSTFEEAKKEKDPESKLASPIFGDDETT